MAGKKPKPVLLMDDREPKLIQGIARRVLGDQVVVKRLVTADYIIPDVDGCQVGIERKAVSDFLASIADKRLVTQMTRVCRDFVPVLLLEGTVELIPCGDKLCVAHHGDGKWYFGAVQMALWSLATHGARILYTPDHAGTVDTLRVLLERGRTKCLAEPGPAWTGRSPSPGSSALKALPS